MKYSRFLQDKLNIIIEDDSLIELALTHPSYANEHNLSNQHYERLEFVGDAILQFLISEAIFKEFPLKQEGELTVLRAKNVREEALASFAKEYELFKYIKVSVGEFKQGGAFKKSILANAFEAMLGAIYLTNGLVDARKFVQIVIDKCFEPSTDDIDEDIENYKSLLQEYFQADSKRTVTYELVSTSGSANLPTFEFIVKHDDLILGHGSGSSKKKAQQEAAKNALEKLALIK